MCMGELWIELFIRKYDPLVICVSKSVKECERESWNLVGVAHNINFWLELDPGRPMGRCHSDLVVGSN
jgi:hypothetical protein